MASTQIVQTDIEAPGFSASSKAIVDLVKGLREAGADQETIRVALETHARSLDSHARSAVSASAIG